MADSIDTLSPTQMAAWLRETAANTRLHGQRPMLTAKEMNVAPHVAFRLEQAARMLEALQGECDRLAALAMERGDRH